MIRHPIAAIVAAALLISWPRDAQAQSFRLDRFRSAERPDDAFGVRRLGDFGHNRWGLNAVFDYADDPLVLERSRDREAQGIIDHELVLKFDVSVALWNRLMLFAGFDAPLVMKGPSPRPGFAVAGADGAGFGDVSLGGRLRLVGDAGDVFGLGVQGVVIAPTAGNGRSYTGEDGVAIRPDLILELRPKFLRLTANIGALLRHDQRLLGTDLRDELVYGLALGVPVHARFELLGEVSGAFSFQDFATRTTTGLEWLLGGKANTASGVYLGAAAGSGVTRGVGTPDLRAVAQLGYLGPAKRPAPEPPPAPPPPPPPLPPSDRDQDGLIDERDRCPEQAEDIDEFEDHDGCPDPDNDADGVLDQNDQCPNDAEDADRFQDENGCPDPDNDGDGVLDVDDACVDEPGVPEEKGCAARVKIEESGEISIAEQILFQVGASAILEQSFPILEAVNNTLQAHPEVTRMRIEGHTDGQGSDAKNLKLSQGRARSVATWLAQRGLDPRRLEVYGCGEKHPIADNAAEEGRAQNRRVVFQIVEPTPSEAWRRSPPVGCRAVKVK